MLLRDVEIVEGDSVVRTKFMEKGCNSAKLKVVFFEQFGSGKNDGRIHDDCVGRLVDEP